MEFRDYYKDLGVDASAGEDAIKQAYRRLARRYHPDVSKEADAEERFKAINEAYEVLRDKDRRSAYDNLRGSYREGQQFRPPPDWNGGGDGFEFQGDFGEGGFSDFFESLFGRSRGFRGAGAGPSPRQPRQPRHLRANLELSLEQAYHGGQQRIQLNGRSYDVRIPAGISAGQSIRLAGQAPGGGDVLLDVGIAPDRRFQVDGRHIVGRVQVMPWQAALGASVQVETLGGVVNLSIPAGSQSGRRLRLKGRGLPGTPAGDHFVVMDVQIPAVSDDSQRDAYRQLARAFGDTAVAG